MPDPEEHIIDRVGKRVFGTIIGLVVGLIVGVVAAVLTVGFGSTALFVGVIGGLTLAGGAIGYLYPGPFLVMAELLLSVFS